MKLVHIGDVHWRGMSRHDEYRRSFSRMFEELKEIKPDAIVVCGDIVHSKTQNISPEIIDQLVWWFREMVAICPVHVILGNHDGNLINPTRQDAISPILNALNQSDIHLYKKSGVYKFAEGFNFCVFSVFDEKSWKIVKPVPGEINIALFHGSVGSATTDHGFELSADLSVEFFRDFDFVLLGDIHKFQFLDYRDCEFVVDESELSNYPSAEIIEEINE